MQAMTTPVQVHEMGLKRGHKRVTHKKSRRGCGNCKLRRVKCDETKPTCKKCTTFQVSCSYQPETPDFQMSFDGTGTIKNLRKPPCPMYQTPSSMLKVPTCPYPEIIPDSNSAFLCNRQSLERLNRFCTRTVFTIGAMKGPYSFQHAVIELTSSHLYLMHTVQTLTSIHDRYLSTLPSSRHTITEVYHLSQAAALFNRKLLEPIQPHDRDGLWATAALLSIVTFCAIEASNPEEAWPLTNSGKSGLEWITMSKCKAAIWNVANPSRPDSLFHSAYENFPVSVTPTTSGIEHLPSAFIQLYSIDSSSTTANNPYRAPLNTLAPLLSIECDRSSFLKFLPFISHMQPDFEKLLEQKDPRALLLLAYWYAKVRYAAWWIERRATFEGQAICLYLERYHADETAIQELLQFPKVRCGLVA